MDIAFTPQVNLPQTATPQTNVGATAEAGAVTTVQKNPDNVVTAATETEDTHAREDDATHKESRANNPPTLDTFQNMKIDGLTTRLGFDDETDVFYLEILQPDTDNILQRIPSESLVEYLNSEFDQLIQEAASRSLRNLDQSI